MLLDEHTEMFADELERLVGAGGIELEEAGRAAVAPTLRWRGLIEESSSRAAYRISEAGLKTVGVGKIQA